MIVILHTSIKNTHITLSLLVGNFFPNFFLIYIFGLTHMSIATNTGRQTYMQADGQQIDNRQAEKQTGRKTDRQTKRQINK